MTTAALSAGEQLDLTALETVVREGLATFIEVGQALAEIRDRRLYRATHRTFEEYAHERWLLSRTRAYRFIDAAKVDAALSPIGDTPANEAQARELAPLKDDEAELLAAWREAQALAREHGTTITAKVVRNAVQKRVARTERERKNGEARESFNRDRCADCGRTPPEIEAAGVPLASGWFSALRDGDWRHLCGECHVEHLRLERERQERQERELAERLGDEGYRRLQQERLDDERREAASKQVRYVLEMLDGGEYGPEQSFLLEIGRWRDGLQGVDPGDFAPDELRALLGAVAEADGLFGEIRALLTSAWEVAG